MPLLYCWISCVCTVKLFCPLNSLRESFETQNKITEKGSMNILHGAEIPMRVNAGPHCKTLIFLYRWSLHVGTSGWDRILKWRLTSDMVGCTWLSNDLLWWFHCSWESSDPVQKGVRALEGFTEQGCGVYASITILSNWLCFFLMVAY